jgi:hypothetical protein
MVQLLYTFVLTVRVWILDSNSADFSPGKQRITGIVRFMRGFIPCESIESLV